MDAARGLLYPLRNLQPADAPGADGVLPVLYGSLDDLSGYGGEGGDQLFGEDFKGFAVGHPLQLLGSLVAGVNPQEPLARAPFDLPGEGEGGVGHRDDLPADDGDSPHALAEEALRILAEEESGGGHGPEVDLGEDVPLPLRHILDDARDQGPGDGDDAPSGGDGLALTGVVVADADRAVGLDDIVHDGGGLGLVLYAVPEGLGELPGAAGDVVFVLGEVEKGVDRLKCGHLVCRGGVGAHGKGVPDGADVGVGGVHEIGEGLGAELLGLRVVGVGLLVYELTVAAANAQDS